MAGNVAQGDTRSFRDHGTWGLLCRPPERAREQCAVPGHHVAVRLLSQRRDGGDDRVVSAAAGLPVSVAKTQ
jgi:hypothetical protein